MKNSNYNLRINFILMALLYIAIGTISCGGSSSSGGGEVVVVPQNLTMYVSLLGVDESNPYGDGSGMVNITFSAQNATSYKVNCGDGEIMETSSTSISHTYIGKGLQDFTIYVSAYNGDKFISTSTDIKIKINTALLWADEFNGSGAPNSSNWTHEIGGHGWGNGEYQYYTNRLDNSKVEGGILSIIAQKETYEGKNYTSARLISKDKFEFKYGRVDIRAKLPTGAGTWPALWMLGSNFDEVGWPACGEIDIMEHWGAWPGKVSSAMHTPACHGGCGTVKVGETELSDYDTAFHVYSMEWDANEVRFLIDDNFLYTYNPSEKNSENWPYDQKFFFILNVAMGPDWNPVDANFTSATMEIDYIRVYQ